MQGSLARRADRSPPGLHDGATSARALPSMSVDIMAPQDAAALPQDAIVEGVIALWRIVDSDVSPVIGRRGSAAVLKRALIMTRRSHRWMPEPSGEATFDECLSALVAAISEQSPDQSRLGRQALQATFQDLLASLVGTALTAALLRAAGSARDDGREPVR